MRSRAAFAAAASAAAALLLAGVLPPLLQREGHTLSGVALRLALSPICHQDPARCWIVAGLPMAICVRCTGLYAGFLAACLASLARGRFVAPPGRLALVAAALPMAVQWSLARAGWPASVDGPLVRTGTGLLLGAVLALYIPPAVAEMRQEIHRLRGAVAAGAVHPARPSRARGE